MTWVRATEIWINPDSPKGPIPVFLNTYTGYNAEAYPDGEWATVDLKPYGVPADAVGAFLGGILIVTGAGDLLLTVRAPGSSLGAENYELQALEADKQGGIRETAATFVPLKDGCFEINIRGVGYPDLKPPAKGSIPSYGVNLTLQAWIR